MKQNLFFLVIAFVAISCNNSNKINPELKQQIMSDTRLDIIEQKAEELIRTGLNAGTSYNEVWIRDLNTFIEPALKVGDKEKISEALLILLQFQGKDGNIVDGYVPIKHINALDDYYIYSDLAPMFAAHKNTVETDQESSLIQAISKYVNVTGDKAFLKTLVAERSVEQRMADAMKFLLNERYSEEYGLLWGATTVDWGDVQPEHDWGVMLDSSSHLCIDIYDNAMFVIAINDYVNLIEDKTEKDYWNGIASTIKDNVRKHLWDSEKQKFIPHIYLDGSPFPEDFDENAIHYHGGTAVAIEAGILEKDEILVVYKQMQANVKAAGAQTIGLTIYPVYPNGFFKNQGMHEYGYQNGGDWTWFGARMVQQLIANGFYKEAYESLSPMLDRVIEHDGFYEWWTPAGEPKGSGMFRGSAGVLWKAIQMFKEECN